MRRFGFLRWRSLVGANRSVPACALLISTIIYASAVGRPIEKGNCPADLTGNGEVAADDLLILLNAWNTGGPGDLDESGSVDVQDLLALINSWGACPVTGPCPSDGDCFVAHRNPGCKDEKCCEAVCAIDDFCCQVQWDDICVAEAFDICGTCGDADAGDCCTPHNSPGCDQWECCVEVCIDDPFCCTVAWDSICADLAKSICGFCPPNHDGAQ